MSVYVFMVLKIRRHIWKQREHGPRFLAWLEIWLEIHGF